MTGVMDGWWGWGRVTGERASRCGPTGGALGPVASVRGGDTSGAEPQSGASERSLRAEPQSGASEWSLRVEPHRVEPQSV